MHWRVRFSVESGADALICCDKVGITRIFNSETVMFFFLSLFLFF